GPPSSAAVARESSPSRTSAIPVLVLPRSSAGWAAVGGLSPHIRSPRKWHITDGWRTLSATLRIRQYNPAGETQERESETLLLQRNTAFDRFDGTRFRQHRSAHYRPPQHVLSAGPRIDITADELLLPEEIVPPTAGSLKPGADQAKSATGLGRRTAPTHGAKPHSGGVSNCPLG